MIKSYLITYLGGMKIQASYFGPRIPRIHQKLRHQQWRVAPEKHGLVPSLLGALVAIRHSAGTRQGGKIGKPR
jgi:hypothetical protein